MKKFPLFEYYTFRFPNNSPDKLSVYVLGWFCIALFGLCIALWDVPAAILVVVFLGLILTGVMLRVNFRTFQLKNPRSVPFCFLGTVWRSFRASLLQSFTGKVQIGAVLLVAASAHFWYPCCLDIVTIVGRKELPSEIL